jgi:enoyl-CoA hydratase/carnithine racemase
MELLPGVPAQSALTLPEVLTTAPYLGDRSHIAEEREDAFEAHYDVHFDPEFGAFWANLKPDSPRNFTPELVAALRQGQMRVESRIRDELDSGREQRLRYQILTSRIPGVFSLGGDLALFRRLIRNRDRDALLRYACACIDLVYTNAVNYKLPVVTISLIQGQALGGGFEAALAANVVVAERQSKLGLPEVMFNMFPGMGAYQLLTRRLTAAKAEELILSGRTYSAEELHQMGLVGEPGHGIERKRSGTDGLSDSSSAAHATLGPGLSASSAGDRLQSVPLLEQRRRADGHAIEKLDDIGVGHAYASVRPGRAEGGVVGTSMDVDEAAHGIDVAEAVAPGLESAEPENAGENPVTLGRLCT